MAEFYLERVFSATTDEDLRLSLKDNPVKEVYCADSLEDLADAVIWNNSANLYTLVDVIGGNLTEKPFLCQRINRPEEEAGWWRYIYFPEIDREDLENRFIDYLLTKTNMFRVERDREMHFGPVQHFCLDDSPQIWHDSRGYSLNEFTEEAEVYENGKFITLKEALYGV